MNKERKMFAILDAFSESWRKVSLHSKSAQDLILIHQNLKPLNKAALISQLSLITSSLTDFAASQFSDTLCQNGFSFILSKNQRKLHCFSITILSVKARKWSSFFWLGHLTNETKHRSNNTTEEQYSNLLTIHFGKIFQC